MDNNPRMDTPTDLEGLQATLKVMARKDVLELCKRANVSASTIQKFRAGIITELGGIKALALLAAMRERAATQADDQSAAA